MKLGLPWLTLVAAFAAAGCAQTGGSVLPGDSREVQTLKAVPIQPSPSPTPTSLVGGLVSIVTGLACGVTAGITCHVLPGTGPQGLPAATAVADLPGLHPADLQSAYRLPSATAGAGQTIGIVVAYDDPDLEPTSPYTGRSSICRRAPPRTGASPRSAPAYWPRCSNGIKAGAKSRRWTRNWRRRSVRTARSSWSKPLPTRCRTLLAAAKTAVAHGATVVSNSYSSSESTGENDAAYAIGVPFVFGAGDAGAAAQWPASSSHVIAVGGTSLARDGSARGWSETVWSLSGGGCSAYVAKPAWQHDTGCAITHLERHRRVRRPESRRRGLRQLSLAVAGLAHLRRYQRRRTDRRRRDRAGRQRQGRRCRTRRTSTRNAAALNAVTSGSNGSCANLLVHGRQRLQRAGRQRITQRNGRPLARPAICCQT